MINICHVRARARLWILAVAVGASTLSLQVQSSDDALLAELSRRSADIKTLTGTFTQAKTIAVLPVPLNSQGEFRVERDKVLWETLAPVRSSLEISGGQINFADAQGKSLLDGTEGADDAKASSEIVARIFTGVIAGDLSALNEYFTAIVSGDSQQWQITLVPRSANMAAYIRHILVQGGELTEQLDIVEANGDNTHIVLVTREIVRAVP